MALQFKKAQRKQAKLRLAISGPSGSGKTMGALWVAKTLGSNIALVDTENRSAELYSEPVNLGHGRVFTPPEFDVLGMEPPYAPERFVRAVEDGAAHVGPDGVLIIDSASAEWMGKGGCLEINEDIAQSKYRGNTWSAWSETTPRHRAFITALVNAPCHVIVTLRSKTETAQEDDGKGKKKVVKLGMKAETRDGFEYEMTTVLDLIHKGHYATATKDRTGLFVGDPAPISDDTGRMLKAWLESGAEVKVEPAPKAGHGDIPDPATSKPDAPTVDDSLELIELDMGDAQTRDDVIALANRLKALRNHDKTVDGAAAEALRQSIYKLGREKAAAAEAEVAA